MKQRKAMETTKETTATKTVQFGMRMEPVLFGAVSDLAVQEDRSIANMIERILKSSPQIQERLEKDTE